MKFTKMHGCGNDYIYINGFTEKFPAEKKPALAVRLSDRHFGIGSDGVIFINPSPAADFAMEMYNADGSRSEMCGNGIRCVGKYVYDNGMTDKTALTVESGGQIKELGLEIQDGQVNAVRVNMGRPEFQTHKIPVTAVGDRVVDEPIVIADKEYKMTCVSVGNPHAVIVLPEVAHLDLKTIGPLFEHHQRFPNRINTEFIRVIDRRTIEMRVWERGSGETLACGTGACAAAAACILNHLTEDKVTVKLLGGELDIHWDREKDLIYMTGPAATVFTGDFPEDTD